LLIGVFELFDANPASVWTKKLTQAQELVFTGTLISGGFLVYSTLLIEAIGTGR
jgi:hypothetical protein